MSQPAPRSTLAPVDLIREIFPRVLNRRDTDAMRPYLADDIVETFPAKACRGREQVLDYFAGVFSALPDFRLEAKSITGEGETVLVRWRMTGTFCGSPWMGMRPTGSRLAIDGVDCFTVRGGRVVENFVVYDQLSFARQIGLMPAPGSLMDRLILALFNARTRLRQLFRPSGGRPS